MLAVSLLLMLCSVLEGMARSFVAEAMADGAPVAQVTVTPFDCKRYDKHYQTVRCVCIESGVDKTPYFCNWSTPADRWGGPRKDPHE